MIDAFLPQLKIESNEDGTITLESEWSGNVDRVAIHPAQLRYLAEEMGLLPELSVSDAELLRAERGRLAEMQRDIGRLKRSMLRIREHALQSREHFRASPGWDHSDLTFEMCQLNALVDLLDMGVDDFVDDFHPVVPDGVSPRVDAAPAAKVRRRESPCPAASVAPSGDPQAALL